MDRGILGVFILSNPPQLQHPHLAEKQKHFPVDYFTEKLLFWIAWRDAASLVAASRLEKNKDVRTLPPGILKTQKHKKIK